MEWLKKLSDAVTYIERKMCIRDRLYVFHVLYFILCTYLTGTTLGKRAMNLRVVSADWGQRLSLLDVVYRETVGRFLCSLSIGIGYIIVGFDGEKRGIHDMLCDTRVIYAKKIKVFPVYQLSLIHIYKKYFGI